MPSRLLVVSIDGVAPRFVTPAVMPALCDLARSGASTFDARTVVPSVTLPAHASLLSGVAPSVHGIVDNTPQPLPPNLASFLSLARAAGRSTAAALNWAPLNGLVEPDAVDHRYFLNGGYGLDEDAQLASATRVLLAAGPDLTFAYVVSPDVVGHEHGWGSTEYLDSLTVSDRALARLLEAAGPDTAVLVTTDHGGHGMTHERSAPIDQVTFLTLRAPGIESAGTWDREVSILDVAPTVAAMLGFDAVDVWTGESLLDGIVPIADTLLSLVERMRHEHYGEALTMLEHSLQTAERLLDRGATDDLVLAGLLHDIGHVLADAGEWGVPEHADVGATHLQAWLPESVTEPVRLHVAAKRYLVSSDPDYAESLSDASTMTLRQQGGPLTDAEAEAFLSDPWSVDAVELRRADEAGKVPGEVPGRDFADVRERWRDLLQQAIVRPRPAARWLRDACCCHDCRDEANGQRLLDHTDADGWYVVGRRGHQWVLRHPVHGTHPVELAPEATDPADERVTTSPATPLVPRAFDDIDAITADVALRGVALAIGLGRAPGTVLDFAASLGHVRSTNYGDLFDVRNEADPTNLAYTTLALPLHTDNPYRDPVPGVQILHCIAAAGTGGRTQLADGFAAALRLREADRDGFDLLATRPVVFSYRSDGVWLRAERPIITVDQAGQVTAVAVNHRSMEPSAATDDVAWYHAYRRFCGIVAEPEHVVDLLLEGGQAIVFDNRRILHARSGFDASQARHLQGCYIDIDAVQSHVRIATHAHH